MNAEDRERQFDEWLDQGLKRYSDVEPRTGLEQRILANLEVQRQARRPWWQWAWIPVAAVLLISAGVLWITRPGSQARPSPVVRVETKAPDAPKGSNAVAPQLAKATPPRRTHRAPVAPRVEEARATQGPTPHAAVFPTPTPLSAQEQAALRLARVEPAEAAYVAQTQEDERERLKKLEEESANKPKGEQR